jgi:HEPN domain-containing protein
VTKKEYITYWETTAKKDWRAVQNLFKSKDYVHSLFWSHLVLEKLCKALWVKHHESNHPPRIHNLIYLIENIPLSADDTQRAFLEKMNTFQLEGRYPDYKYTLYKMCTKKFTEETLKEANKIRQWLLKAL